jgi:hypothetical protein
VGLSSALISEGLKSDQPLPTALYMFRRFVYIFCSTLEHFVRYQIERKPMLLINMKFPTLVFCAIVLSACAQGGRVAMGTKYPAVAPQSVQLLFQAPSWPAEQIGIVTSQGAQIASDATVYQELQHQAAVLGADAVLIVSSGMRQYAAMPGFATYNAFGQGNLFGNNFGITGAAHYQATGFAMGPQRFVGLNVQGIALKRTLQQARAR